jgi:hypothetical protein
MIECASDPQSELLPHPGDRDRFVHHHKRICGYLCDCVDVASQLSQASETARSLLARVLELFHLARSILEPEPLVLTSF